MVTKEEIYNASILIICDSEDDLLFLEDILMSNGYRIVNKTAFLQGIKEVCKSYKPDIVILDMDMPLSDNYNIIKDIRDVAKYSFIPVLVTAAKGNRGLILKALKSGAKDFVVKPLNREEILLRVRNLIEISLLNKKVGEQKDFLEKKVAERTRELKDTRLEIIRRLSLAAEFKDPGTGAHIIRMSKMCQLMAKEIGFSEEESELVLQASTMHDIGKIGIPDRIISKPGKLSADEWKTMKTHTTIGEKILKDHPSNLLTTAKTIALFHHERWDGNGYPKGISGKKIPLVGRICAVCDVFDALLSKRPYKEAWTVYDAMSEIRRESGFHFDPALVDTFLSILPSIVAIRDGLQKQENMGMHIIYEKNRPVS